MERISRYLEGLGDGVQVNPSKIVQNVAGDPDRITAALGQLVDLGFVGYGADHISYTLRNPYRDADYVPHFENHLEDLHQEIAELRALVTACCREILRCQARLDR